MILILTFIISTLIILISWISLLNNCRRINVKGPLPLPILGNAHLFSVKSTEFLHLLQRLSLKYGDAFLVQTFSRPVVFLSHPRYIEPLMLNTKLITKGRSYRLLTSWLGQGLLTSKGQRWKTHRKLLTPAFHFNILQTFLPIFCKNQDILTEKLRGVADGRPMDLFSIVALFALDNVTETIMGVPLNAQIHNESEYVKSIETLKAIIAMRIRIPILGVHRIFNLLPYKTKQDRALMVVHEQTKSVIEMRRAELKKGNISDLNGSNDFGIRNRHAFLDLLLLAEIDGKRIDNTSVREEVDTFMFAGLDTTSSGLVYSLYCLSKHRDVQQKVYEEQRKIFVDDLTIKPTFNDLKEMRYLEMVIKESMRLYPPAPIIERFVTQDCDLGELKLKAGTSVVVNIFQSQRHPDVFEDPLEFRPERFQAPLKNPFDWLVFSAGSRNCIGQKFAMMELKVSLSAIIRNFVLLPVDREPELCVDLVLSSKNDVQIRLIPRN